MARKVGEEEGRVLLFSVEISQVQGIRVASFSRSQATKSDTEEYVNDMQRMGIIHDF